MHHTELILTLTCGLAAALGLGYLAHRLGLSPIVGYLLAGIVVGPHTPGFVADRTLAEQLAEIGVILLMFGVGLHFQIQDLLAVRMVALPGAIAQISAAAVAGVFVASLFGFSVTTAVVYGLCISIASTVVLTRVLSDNSVLHTPLGHAAVGWLVLQDIYAVFALVLMPPFLASTGESLHPAALVGLIAAKIAALILLVFVAGGRTIPWLFRHVARTRSRELFTLTVLVLALGIAVGSALMFGVSMALGAFLAGMVVGRSEFSLRAATEALPMRDAFAVLFFVAAGMLFDPGFLLQSPGLVFATLGVVMLVTPITAALAVVLVGRPVMTALSLGLALAQIGEFSFMLSQLGLKLGILPHEAVQAIVAVAIITISVNPILYRVAKPLERWICRQPWLRRQLARTRLERYQDTLASTAVLEADPRYQAVVVGYGPVGRTLVRLLRENGVTPRVIELNVESVRELRGQGIEAVYGDANHSDTLEAVRLAEAGTLFLTSSGMTGGEEVVRRARELNPTIRVVARVAYQRQRCLLEDAGADEVYAGESEVALALVEAVLRPLGATPEQIDRERDKLRTEIDRRPNATTTHGGSRLA